MADWGFDVLPGSLVETEPTQRDQFNNDEVELGEALVREVIQNSSDAALEGDSVKVRFAFTEIGGARTSALKELFEPLRPHFSACEIDVTAIESDSARVLVIEDFQTRGLTGRTDDFDGENFHNFWRRHGLSAKKGKSGGRWGLGKLVFSSASAVRAFFGLTVRYDDRTPLLMGQAVLSNHKLNNKRYPAHAFWFGSRGPDEIQLPVTDQAVIAPLSRLFGFQRVAQPGLSIAVPYPSSKIDEESIIGAVVQNYYFPILAGRLSVEVGEQAINQTTFHDVAAALVGKDALPLEFVEEVNKSPGKPFEASKPLSRSSLDQEAFSNEQLAEMRSVYSGGQLLRVRVPVHLAPKDGASTVVSFIDLYLKALKEGQKPFALFVRGSITVPGEAKYSASVHAFGAMVAADDGVAAFLGDAENPAHTGWNGNAEKLVKRWKAPAQTLRNIRYALRELYGLVSEKVEQKDSNALIDFFSIPDYSAGAKRPERTGIDRSIPTPRPKGLIVTPIAGGFTIRSGPAAQSWEYPRTIDVRVAYDLASGNPFKRYSSFDFDLAKAEIEKRIEDGEILSVAENKIRAEVTSSGFQIRFAGFDTNRDIIVDARVLP